MEMRLIDFRGSVAVRCVRKDSRGREYIIVDGCRYYRGLHWR